MRIDLVSLYLESKSEDVAKLFFARLEAFDEQLKAANDPKKVKALIRSSEDWTLKIAVRLVKQWILRRNDPTFNGRGVRAWLGRLKRPMTDGSELDLDALYEDATAWAASKSNGSKAVPRYIVAQMVDGLTPDSRRLRK